MSNNCQACFGPEHPHELCVVDRGRHFSGVELLVVCTLRIEANCTLGLPCELSLEGFGFPEASQIIVIVDVGPSSCGAADAETAAVEGLLRVCRGWGGVCSRRTVVQSLLRYEACATSRDRAHRAVFRPAPSRSVTQPRRHFAT